MKQFPISSKNWVAVMAALIVLMIGATVVVKNKRAQASTDPPLNTLGSESNPPINSLDNGDLPPPMPTDSGTLPPVAQNPNPDFNTPSRPAPPPPKAEQRMPVVWVTETDAKAYSQPGFNMPIVRNLEQWEELLIVETSKENWDRVQDLKGQQFWVQKKVVTIIRPQNMSQPSVAEKKVMDFYTQVAHREHSDAYVHLSPEWKRELSYDDFVRGYQKTDSLRSEIVNIIQLGEERYQVDVAMEAIENGDTVDYLGIYVVEKVQGKWYLTSGSLNRQANRL